MRLYRYRWLIGLAIGVLVIDQLTKAWISAVLPYETMYPYGSITVIPGFFHLVNIGNTGAAWGMFEGRSFWLAVLALATLAAIVHFRRQLELNRPIVQVCFGLLCGGIVGNFIDRLSYGYVVDFLLFHIGRYHWPVFNLADTAICVGVGLYLVHSFRQPHRSTSDSAAPPQRPK